MKIRKQSILLIVFIVLTVFVLVSIGPSIASALGSNIGWFRIHKKLTDETVNVRELDLAGRSFSQAARVSPGNGSAWFGLGMAKALQGKVDEAIQSWSNTINDPATLLTYGLNARARGDLNMALTQFRAADTLGASEKGEGNFFAGTICQRALANQAVFSESNQRYCANYFEDNDRNLIVNNSFSTGSTAGWDGDFFFFGTNSAQIETESTSVPDDFMLRLDGYDESEHFGLFQRLTLAPGDKVRFSGRFRLSGEDNLMARILYIGWQLENGTVHGNYALQRSKSMGWTELERTFLVPENSKSNIDFYPLLFSGAGSVWYDDIRLELIRD